MIIVLFLYINLFSFLFFFLFFFLTFSILSFFFLSNCTYFIKTLKMTTFYDDLPVLESWYQTNNMNQHVKPTRKMNRNKVKFDPSPTINYYSESSNRKAYSIKAWIPFYRHRR
ncbi:unnamed protein product [Cunninghamella blakesleeana]